MLIISTFYGITIAIQADEYHPPRFHAHYDGEEAIFSIRTGKLVDGSINKRANSFVQEWAKQHTQELLDNWERIGQQQTVVPIEPLE